MHQAQAIIERVRRVSGAIQQIDIAVDKSQQNIGAGQLFLARTTETLDPYLREPWTPVHREGSSLTIERSSAQSFSPGQVVNLLGPVGKVIPLRESARTLLLIAYESTPVSLLMLAETALAKGIAVALALLGTAIHYPLEALPQEMEVQRGYDYDQWPNQVEMVKWADQIVAVAPPPLDLPYYGRLLDSVKNTRREVAPGYLYGLVQPPMPCGIGACQACLVRCGKDEIPACLDGPAFDVLALTAHLAEGK
ncbi:MAG: hypothetical protein ABI947_13550 [Chloroflexota bacterium]